MTESDAAQICENGLVLARQGDCEQAALYFAAALELDPTNIDAANNLCVALIGQGRFAEALEYAVTAVQRTTSATTWGNLGIVLFRLGRFAEAERAYQYSLAHDAADPVMQYNLAFAQLSLGNYKAGWEQIRWRKQTTQWAGREPFSSDLLPTWQGEPDKSVLLFCEQGLGDSIMLSRYIPEVQQRSRDCTISCPVGLARLFRDSFSDLKFFADTGSSPKMFDYQCSLWDLPQIMGITRDNIPRPPYLKTNPSLIDRWQAGVVQQKLIPDMIHIGLVWAGGARDGAASRLTDSRRSISLAQYVPFFRTDILEKIQFVSLQKGPPSEQVEQFPCVADFAAEIDDFADTAALVSFLDLVISVDTSVVHLAGALDRPVVVLNRFDACQPWLPDPERTPWYGDNLIEMRQTAPGDWNSVIDRCRDVLVKHISA